MKIHLEQAEIEQAIVDYVHTRVSVEEGYEVTVDKLVAGRGDKGLSVEVSIAEEKPEVEVTAEQPVKQKRAYRRKTAVLESEGDQASSTNSEASLSNSSDPEPTKEDPPFEQDKVSEVDPQDGTVQTAQQEVQEPVKDPEPTKQSEDVPAPRKSIFSGLQKPSNN